MKNIFGIFRCDVRRITASVVSVIVIIGLCLVPCLYAWFNIMSNADPYGPASTSNIKVVVANEDEGSELLGLHFNIGDMVVDGISANDQMGWIGAIRTAVNTSTRAATCWRISRPPPPSTGSL